MVQWRFSFRALISLYFVYGVLTAMNDLMIPLLKKQFALSYSQSMLVQLSFFTAFTLTALPFGKLISRRDYRYGLRLGVVLMALGAVLITLATQLAIYAVYLAGFFAIAAGITAIQVAGNPVSAEMGPAETASARMNIVQGFFSVGATVAPLFGAWLIFSVAPEPTPYLPYLLVLSLLVGQFVLLGRIALPAMPTAEASQTSGSIWQQRHVVLGAIGIFCYVGAEVSAVSFMVSYLQLPQIANLSIAQASVYISVFWGLIMVGRLGGSVVLSRFAPQRVLLFNVLVCIALITLVIYAQGALAMWALITLGLFKSIIFPTIFSLGIRGLGQLAPQAAGVLLLGVIGGGIVPVTVGAIADVYDLQNAFHLLYLNYAYLLFYAWRGYRSQATNIVN